MPSNAPSGILRRLEWRVRHAATASLAGDYRCAFRGRGRDFDQVVKYTYGDDVRDIDWNVTARLGEIYRKEFIAERELTVVLLFEDTPSLQFGSASRTKREAILELAGLFALLSASNGDRVGFWHSTPAEQIVREPVRGRGRILASTARFLDEPVPELDEAAVDLDWKRLYQAFPRRSILLWFGDFAPRPLPPAWAALRRRYQVVGARVEDPWERRLPGCPGFGAIDPIGGELVPFDPGDTVTQQRHLAWVRQRDDYYRSLFPAPADTLTVGTTEDPLAAMVRFFHHHSRAATGVH